jgi:hypothetical protein
MRSIELCGTKLIPELERRDIQVEVKTVAK